MMKSQLQLLFSLRYQCKTQTALLIYKTWMSLLAARDSILVFISSIGPFLLDKNSKGHDLSGKQICPSQHLTFVIKK